MTGRVIHLAAAPSFLAIPSVTLNASVQQAS
jgi:hypothetical protein